MYKQDLHQSRWLNISKGCLKLHEKLNKTNSLIVVYMKQSVPNSFSKNNSQIITA